jgi:hypothetical protein
MKSLLLLGLLGALGQAPPCGRVCSCAHPRTATVARDRATAVFTGRVLSVRDTVFPVNADGYRSAGHVAVLVVDRAWKGVESDTVPVVSSEPCSFRFQAGHAYLVYAHAAAGALHTGMCDRTAPFAAGGRVADDLRELGAPARTWPAAADGP